MPSDILKLEFENTESDAVTVGRLLPTINYYRSKNKTLADIHKALLKLGKISMSFGSFKNSYYSQRAKSNLQPVDENYSTVQKIKKSDTPARAAESVSSTVPRKLHIGNLDLADELANHQAQAAAVFQEN